VICDNYFQFHDIAAICSRPQMTLPTRATVRLCVAPARSCRTPLGTEDLAILHVSALIISPHFPPSTIEGVHRARHLVKHLPAHWWRAKVICFEPEHHIERLDPEVLNLVPADVAIIKVGALPVALTIERSWGVPFVLDFQDPRVSAVGAPVIVGRKAWLAHQLAVAYEPKAVRRPAFVTSVSDRQNDEFADRHPFLERSRRAGIPIGGDPADFASRRTALTQAPDNAAGPVFSYVGTVLPR
jgi:hypothetical protein